MALRTFALAQKSVLTVDALILLLPLSALSGYGKQKRFQLRKRKRFPLSQGGDVPAPKRHP